jgi:ABC-type uncharacterized transport system fused permease/ATPase subunit
MMSVSTVLVFTESRGESLALQRGEDVNSEDVKELFSHLVD